MKCLGKHAVRLAALSGVLAAAAAFGQPVNDLCANATVLSGPGTHAFDSTGGTSDPRYNGTSPGPGVWFRYTPTSSGVLTVDTCGLTSFQAGLDARQTCDGPVLAHDWGTGECNVRPTISFSVTAGVDVLILVSGRSVGDFGSGSIAITESAPTPPANDLCVNAAALAVGTINVTTQNATAQGFDSCNSSGDALLPDVFFRYVAPQDGVLSIAVPENSGSEYVRPDISLYDECDGVVLRCGESGATLNGRRIIHQVVAGEDYYLRYSGSKWLFTSTPLTVALSSAVPAFDHCDQALTVGLGDSGPYSNFGADTSIASSCPLNQATNSDLFFSFTAPADGIYSVERLHDGNHTWKLSVHTTCGGPSLDCETSNSSYSAKAYWVAFASQVYIIRLATSGYISGPTQSTLRISAETTAANDLCTNAALVTSGNTYPYNTNLAAGNEGSSSCDPNGSSSHDLWYRFDAAQTGTLVLDASNNVLCDPILSVFAGCGGAELACDNDLLPAPDPDFSALAEAHVVMPVSSGVSYWIRLATLDDGTQTQDGPGSGQLEVAFYPLPANDACSNAQVIQNGETDVYSWGATTDGPSTCGGTGRHDVWFHYTATSQGILVAETLQYGGQDFSDAFETVISIYDACNGNELACNTGDNSWGLDLLQSRVFVPAALSQQFIIRLSGSDSTFGAANVNAGQGHARIRMQIVQPPTPCVSPAPGSVPEQEVCGQLPDPNGGCRDDSSGFADVTLPISIFGTQFAYDLDHDEDWFRFMLTEAADVTVTLSAELIARVMLFDTACPPWDDASGYDIHASSTLAWADMNSDCDSIAIKRFVPAGTYYVLVLPLVGVGGTGQPCLFNHNYSLFITNEKFGACCIGASACSVRTPFQCAAQGGVYRGDNTTCVGYGVIPEPFEDISATGTRLSNSQNGLTRDIGFPFTYFGNTFTQVRINRGRGHLLFDSTDTPAPAPIPSGQQPNNIIAPLWLDPNYSVTFGTHPNGIYWRRDGLSPNQRFIVSWQGVQIGDPDVVGVNSNSFQVVLHETTNKIEFRYGSILPLPLPVPYSYVIGIEDGTGSNGVAIPDSVVGAGNISFEIGASRGACACFADFNADGVVSIDDLFLYLNAYFQGSSTANTNGVGGVTIDDLFLFINAYFVGC